MVPFVCLLVLLQDPQPKNVETEPAPKEQSAADYCQTAWMAKLSKILDVEVELSLLKENSDWDKLSKEAKAKIEKPLQDRLAKIKKDRQMDLNEQFPTDIKVYDVFSFEQTNARQPINDSWRVDRVIDKATVIAIGTKWEAPEKGEPPPGLVVTSPPRSVHSVVFRGLKPSEISAKPDPDLKVRMLKLRGLWHRIEDLKLDGKTYVQVARWPHEEEARKMWPAFLEEKQKAFDEGTAGKAKTADKQQPKPDSPKP